MPDILQVDNVDRHFRSGFWMKRVQALHGVSLSVPERSIFGFLGANGAGKTTLIHLIVGLFSPSAGTVRIGGMDATSVVARSRIGYLPERPYFHEHLTGASFLRFYGRLSGMTDAAIAARTDSVLATVGLKGVKALELRKFSKGMLQRIGIAQALIHDPELLVLDEPMSGLDPVGRREIRELMLHLAAEGRTVFFSTHVIPDAEAICDRVALIRSGRMVGSGPIHAFLGDGKQMTEIAFASGRPEAEWSRGEFSSARRMPEGYRMSVAGGPEAVNAMLAKLMGLQATILWVAPQRPSLEGFFQPEEGARA